MMKSPLLVALVMVVVAGTATAGEIHQFNLDDAAAIGTTIETDSVVKAEGEGSVKIMTRYPTTVCLGEVVQPAVENAKLIYRAKVKSDIQGVAFLEMWAHLGGKRYFSRGLNDAVEGKSDWRTLETPFLLQKGQRPDKVTLNVVINGTGTLWIDAAALLREPLP